MLKRSWPAGDTYKLFERRFTQYQNKKRKRIPKQITVYGADTYNNSRVNLFNADHSYSEHDTWDKRPPTRGWTAGRIHQSRTDRQTDGRAMSWQYWGQPVPRARERLATNLFSPLRNRFPDDSCTQCTCCQNATPLSLCSLPGPLWDRKHRQ